MKLLSFRNFLRLELLASRVLMSLPPKWHVSIQKKLLHHTYIVSDDDVFIQFYFFLLQAHLGHSACS